MLCQHCPIIPSRGPGTRSTQAGDTCVCVLRVRATCALRASQHLCLCAHCAPLARPSVYSHSRQLRLFMLRNLQSRAMSVLKKPRVLFVLGGPGAGKGTVCTNIVKKYGYVHLSAGDLLREERAKPDSEFGELIEGHIRNGTIVPVEITCNLLDRAIQNSDTEHKKFLIDGFPRNADNLRGWTQEMSDKVQVDGVLFFDCKEEVCTQRCLGRGARGSGRTDDNLETLKKRHQTYVKDTMPIVEHYKKLGLVYSFNGEKPPKKVFADVEEVLKKIGW